jgi:uncharacterized membrane protein YbhN (UPF0104 family)
LKKNQLILGVVVLAALVALVVWGSNRIHFDFGVFRAQLAMASWAKIGIAVGFIYIGYLFRSVRWAFLLRHEKKVPPFSLLSTQVIGFAAVALIGRVADPVRPYLVAKKTGLPLSNQLAVYIVERLFDFGAMALIISSALLWIPYPQTAATTNTSGFFAHLLAPLLHRFPVAWSRGSQKNRLDWFRRILDAQSATRSGHSMPGSMPSVTFPILPLSLHSR